MGCDKVLCFISNDVGYVFILPKGGLPATHPSDAGDAIDNCIVVSLAGFQGYEFRIFFPCRPIADFMVVAYGDRIISVKSYDVSVLYKYTWQWR